MATNTMEKAIYNRTELLLGEDVMEALERKDDVQNWVMESLKARIKKIREENTK